MTIRATALGCAVQDTIYVDQVAGWSRTVRWAATEAIQNFLGARRRNAKDGPATAAAAEMHATCEGRAVQFVLHVDQGCGGPLSIGLASEPVQHPRCALRRNAKDGSATVAVASRAAQIRCAVQDAVQIDQA